MASLKACGISIYDSAEESFIGLKEELQPSILEA